MIILANGGYSLFPLTLATLGWVASLTPDACDFVRVTGPAVEYITKSDVIPYIEAGMVSYRIPTYYPDEVEWRTIYTDSCLSYDFDSDFAWKFGKICKFLGTFFGGGCAFFLWTAAFCLTLPRNTWRWFGIGLLVSAIFESFSFIWMTTSICERGSIGSGAGCHLFFGSNVCIFSSISYAAAAVAIFLKYPEPKIIKLTRQKILHNMNSVGAATPPTDRDFESIPSFNVSSRSGNRSTRSNLLT